MTDKMFFCFTNGEEAFAKWYSESISHLEYPPFHEWIYMTEEDINKLLNPPPIKIGICKDCISNCPYRRDTCWSCVMPKLFNRKQN